jgi:micrococcal nuclease
MSSQGPPRSLGRRVRRAVLWSVDGVLALSVLLVIIGGLVGPPPVHPASATAPAPAAALTSSTALASAPLNTPATPTAPPPPAAPAGQVVAADDVEAVTRVVDGDTFNVGARRIRVLGIDSCESASQAGPVATAQARSLLLGRQVTLTGEAGVDRDRYGRELRYVRLPDGHDFGTVMVAATHTAVYAGHNDANPSYVAPLQATDPNGRTCDPAPVPVLDTSTRGCDLNDPGCRSPGAGPAPTHRNPIGVTGRPTSGDEAGDPDSQSPAR